MELKEMLFKLSSAVGVGTMSGAAELISDMLSEISDDIRIDFSNSVTAFIKGKKDYTVLLEAHADEIGLIVTEINGGFLRAAKCGGVDIRILPGSSVRIHGEKIIKGVVTALPPHLCKNDKEYEDIDKLWIDVGGEVKHIAVGDYISFDYEPKELIGNQVTGKSFDDRASCAAIIFAAQKILKRGVPPCNIVLAFASGEELGNRGAITTAFETAPDEAIAVDVSFGFSPGVPVHKCGKMGEGAMIGISPVLSDEVTKRLENAAKSSGSRFQYEVMGGETSTDADVISITKSGVPCGLLSIPLKNMHTPTEIVDLSDVLSVAEILAEYVLKKEQADV